MLADYALLWAPFLPILEEKKIRRNLEDRKYACHSFLILSASNWKGMVQHEHDRCSQENILPHRIYKCSSPREFSQCFFVSFEFKMSVI